MIIFNNEEMPLKYLQKDRRGQALDQLVIEIRSRIADPKELLQTLKDGQDVSELVSISVYKTGEGKYVTQAQYQPAESFMEDEDFESKILSEEELEELDVRGNDTRSDLAKAFESFVFNNPWRAMPFELCEVPMNDIITQLSCALGIMPTLKDIPDKSVQELIRMSNEGDKLYWGFADISASNHLPSQRDIEFYQSLNDYEKRIINTSGVHPMNLLRLAEHMKSRGGNSIILTSQAEKYMHRNSLSPAQCAVAMTTPSSEKAKNEVPITSTRMIPFALYAIDDECSPSEIQNVLETQQMESSLKLQRSVDASRTTEMLAASGYLHNTGVPMLSDIHSTYSAAIDAINQGQFGYNPAKLEEWKKELEFEDFAMAMWHAKAGIDIPALINAITYSTKGTFYQNTISKYKEWYLQEFLPSKNGAGYNTEDVKDFAKTKYVAPKLPLITKAEEYSRELFKGFVPRVLAEYVYAQLDVLEKKPSECSDEKLKEIVASFDRTSVSKIAKYKNSALFALSNKLNFAEIKQEHAEVFATFLTATDVGKMEKKKFVEWYKEHKDVSTSDLTELLNHASKIERFDKQKSAQELIDDVVNSFGKSECRNMEARYHYSFAENELAIRGRHVTATEGKLKMYMLQANDYRNFTVGYDTHCCQHYGNAGESCVWKATQDPFAGVVVIERDGDILAQAFIWTDESKDTLVFDNMEFANDRNVSSFTSIIAAWCEAMPYSNIHMGMGYNTLGNGFGKPVAMEDEARIPTTIRRNPCRDCYADDGVDIYTDYHVGRSYGNKARALKKDNHMFIQNRSNVRITTRPDEPTRWDIMMRPENSIWLNDFHSSVEDRLAFSHDFLTNQTADVQMKAVKKNPLAIRYIEHPTPAVQEYVIQRDPSYAVHINDPCEHVQNILIDMDCSYIRKIAHPSETMAVRAVQANGLLLEAIPDEFKTENVVKEAVKQNGYAIKFVQNPSEEVLRLAVTSTPKVITMIPGASLAVKHIAVNRDPNVLRLMDHPEEELQLIGVEADPYVINSIKEPSYNAIKRAVEKQGLIIRNFQYQYPELRMTAIEANPFALRVLKDPTQEECLSAVLKNRAVMSLIKDPELSLWISHNLAERDNDPNMQPEAPQSLYADMREETER